MTSQLQLRRATVDDLPALKSLWQAARLPADELEGRLTEFQVVEDGGMVAGAFGVQIVRHHARFYAEDFKNFAVADAARELFWDRLQTLAANHGVFRVWTQETSPFWTHWGFQVPNAETLSRLPEEWKHLEGRWLTTELKNEEVISTALNSRFAGLMDAEKQQTADLAAKARRLRLLVTIFGFAFFTVCVGLAVYLLFRHPLANR